ncbi:MAG: hypothetical protein Q7K29_01715 [Thermoleophilia bacterium]|nr:hypothetical protein [Thermoleophilia bacterium]
MIDKSMRSRAMILIAGLIAMAAIALASGGCGEDTQEGTTGTSTVKSSTATTPTATTSTGMDTTVSVPPSPAPEAPSPSPDPAADASSGPFSISDRQVDPEVIAPGGTTTFSAWVNGEAASVTITVYKLDSGALAMTVPLSFDLHAGSGIYKWSAAVNVPTAKGVYRYYASAVSTGGVTAEMPGVSGWTFCVGDPTVDCI